MAAPFDLRFDCGRICLDLMATTGRRAERLAGPEHLAAWLVGSGVVPGSTQLGAVDRGWVVRFRMLRELLRRVVHDELRGRAAEADLHLLNAAATAAVPPARAVRTEDGVLVRAFTGPPDCTGLLAAVARDAIGMLTDAVARGQLRQCEGESCSLVYLDTSRGRRRRWCSSEVCGNRERVARHRRRATRRADGAVAEAKVQAQAQAVGGASVAGVR
ncbi:ABATE domain-containing protein [Streptomyces rimosus]|uniref:CGNR zinc finger domain-containing protein n=1 Tax=Streptomyces rimosus TaxID=1927 RepID=UPI000518D144|nr:ABATE domain-containing protein [Streptomyces rimosus]